jgi:Sec-independent protein translocase protein TatA
MRNRLPLTSRLPLLAFLGLVLVARSSLSVAAFVPCGSSSSASRLLLPRPHHPQPSPSNAVLHYRSDISNRIPARTRMILPRPSRAATTQLRLFGLGLGEIVLVLVGIALVLGPEKLGEMVRSSSETAKEYQQELSKVPDEFQKGMAEGEIEARARKAKPMRKVGVAEKKTSRSDNNTEEE